MQQLTLLEEEATRALQSGRPDLALKAWEKALCIDSNNVRVLMAMGQHAFRTGEFLVAAKTMERVVAVDGKDCQQWVNLAMARQKMHDELGEEEAIRGALRADPSDLLALMLKANLLQRQGKTHLAAKAHGAVIANAPAMDRLLPSLRPALQQALAFREKYDKEFGAFMDQYLDPVFRSFAGEDLGRFRDSLDITIGRKRRYDSQPAVYYYPNLAPIEFFDRADFPWLDAVEAATDDIRTEFLSILDAEQGFTPYLTYPDDVPHFQFAELNNSPRWSAFHIYENGELVQANAPKCPKTIALLAGCPQPAQAGRTPTAMFSLLKPKTHIPPHTGVTNARLVTHLPLIIPADCGFRVGNHTQQWETGKAWVFDDTIEHEAWNNSDKLRVVLIFDIWHPHLTPPERAMITAMAQAITAFSADDQGYGL
ncbi:aspartyl/asparaginyl beta-hydroxylase domain-containing protein [Roseateles sp.]|uniref:aspartyl/asparaginyl beta-hydroxylase domain-containing protein n=1 Tax=Roseateles sp. TaxID=1971397 RepID=UPI002869F7CE|nr:aspartyl/asparaginyl beta-hydroxylase domain-containing protein [Roseateles sp.]